MYVNDNRVKQSRRRFISQSGLICAGILSMSPKSFFTKDFRMKDELPPWEEGYLDIHHINTGRGDSTFFVLPDGTSLLIDAGALYRERPPHYDLYQRQDESLRPGQWIARYIQKFCPNPKRVILDYALITHFHGDHMGGMTDNLPFDESGTYKLSGITDVGTIVPIKIMVDRGWPDYSYPENLKKSQKHVANYQKFINWHIAHNNMQVQKFIAGMDSQIRLNFKPNEYAQFRVENIAVNGRIWTREGNNLRNRYPEGEVPEENNNSCVLRLKYGNFTYYTGGDIQTTLSDEEPAWHDMESAVASVVGPVDIMTLNHHGFKNTTNAFFLSTLKPRVIIESVYAASHPGYDVLKHILSNKTYEGSRDVFMLNGMWPGREKNMIDLFGEEKAKWLKEQIEKIVKFHGHIVVRVKPGGGTYYVYILNDDGKNYNILKQFGPYVSKNSEKVGEKF